MGAALYVAISTDTGCFRFNNTTADTLRCAAACKDTGADTFAINTALFMTKRLPRLQLEARLTEEMEFYAGGAVAREHPPERPARGAWPDGGRRGRYLRLQP